MVKGDPRTRMVHGYLAWFAGQQQGDTPAGQRGAQGDHGPGPLTTRHPRAATPARPACLSEQSPHTPGASTTKATRIDHHRAPGPANALGVCVFSAKQILQPAGARLASQGQGPRAYGQAAVRFGETAKPGGGGSCARPVPWARAWQPHRGPPERRRHQLLGVLVLLLIIFLLGC